MLGLFLGILMVSGCYYFVTRRKIAQTKREKVMSQLPIQEMIPSSLNLPEQWLAIRSGNVAAVSGDIRTIQTTTLFMGGRLRYFRSRKTLYFPTG